MRYISLETAIEDIRSFYNQGNNTYDLFPNLENSSDEESIMMLIFKHRKEDYINLVIEKVFSGQVSEKLVQYVYKLFKDNSLILNEIVMSGKATVEILTHLASSSDKHLAEHSKLGLILHRLRQADKGEYHRIYEEHASDDNAINHAVRYHLATYKNTPTKILEILLSDTHKHVSEAARSNLDLKKLK